MSGQTKAALKDLHLQARAAGRSKRFLASVKEILERLRADPVTFGEPLYRLPTLKLLVCHGLVSFVVVDYAVHEEKPLVFIRGFKMLS
jgi:hypothetical protein